MSISSESLGSTLQRARKASRLSQLELSMQVGISQRHMSYCESGRVLPSRSLLVTWLQVLNVPLAVQNEAMQQSGYAPIYATTPLGNNKMSEACFALKCLLETHDPMPAFVLDAHWNILNTNRGGSWLMQLLAPELIAENNATPLNMLDLVLHPKGLSGKIRNLNEVGPAFLVKLREDEACHPALTSKVNALQQMLGSQRPLAASGQPLLTTRFACAFGELAFFSIYTTFGTPQDITLSSLRVEHLFPADQQTRQELISRVGAKN